MSEPLVETAEPEDEERVLATLALAFAADAVMRWFWPEPAVYADEGPVLAEGYGPELARLSAAIAAGRHDAVMIPGPGIISGKPADLMAFLFRCTRHGVAVEFIGLWTAAAFLTRPPPGARYSPQVPPSAIRPGPSAARPGPSAVRPGPSAVRPGPSVARQGRPPAARQGTPVARQGRLAAARPGPSLPRRCAARSADVLAMAGVEALTRLFPDWLIWADDHGWHARRRGEVYVQAYGRGAPAFCVRAVSALDLAAQLRWQQAADIHAPAGCPHG